MFLSWVLLFRLLAFVGANKFVKKSHQEQDVSPLALEVIPRKVFSDLAGYDVSDKLLNVSYSRNIPKIIWISVANASDEFPPHISEFTSRNKDWRVKIVGNLEKDKFINTIFAGTRVQWAYNMINPRLGASKCDIWRYATLYLYGGFYMDYDATIRTPLNDIIQRDDTLIVAQDGTPFYDYFRPQFKLSNKATFFRFTNFTEFALQQMHGKDPKTGYPKLFHGMVSSL